MTQHNSLYIDGRWQAANSTLMLDVINPATRQLIAQVPSAAALDVDLAVAAARKALLQWSNSSAAYRAQILRDIAAAMLERKDELVQAISASMGCPEHIASWLQVDGPIEAMDLFADLAEKITSTEQMGHSLVVKEAVGVCAFINPWNYPLHQVVGKVGAALAAGCTMVVKPSEQTPLQDYILAEIMHDVGVPAGVFNLVPGTGPVVGAALSGHHDVDMLSFTGSTLAGTKVAHACADTVKRVALELGGKSPLIISESADLQKAVNFGVDDVMLNSGQTCTALTRMLVPRSCYQEATQFAKARAESLLLGMHDKAFLGPMCSAAQQKKVFEYIEIGIKEGATLLCGDTKPPQRDDAGLYVAPTIFSDVDNTMRIAQEEIFGPVLCMIAYDTVEEALAIANDSPYGLSSGVYAGSDQEAVEISRRIRAGLCFINGGEFNYYAPFGGVKQSGNGREFSMQGVEEFLESKSLQLPSDSSLLK